jgi:hypothetical protein
VPFIAAIASTSSSDTCRASRSNASPAAVVRAGLPRWISTWPTRLSSALIR